MPNTLPVILAVPVDPDWRWGTKVQLFTNNGSGEVDYDAPLLTRPHDVFARSIEPKGHAAVPHAVTPHATLQPAPPHGGGHALTPHATVPHAAGEAYAEVMVKVAEGFGVYTFGAKAVIAGNVQAGDPVEFEHLVSGENPPPVTLAYAGYDSETDQVSFDLAV